MRKVSNAISKASHIKKMSSYSILLIFIIFDLNSLEGPDQGNKKTSKNKSSPELFSGVYETSEVGYMSSSDWL